MSMAWMFEIHVCGKNPCRVPSKHLISHPKWNIVYKGIIGYLTGLLQGRAWWWWRWWRRRWWGLSPVKNTLPYALVVVSVSHETVDSPWKQRNQTIINVALLFNERGPELSKIFQDKRNQSWSCQWLNWPPCLQLKTQRRLVHIEPELQAGAILGIQ